MSTVPHENPHVSVVFTELEHFIHFSRIKKGNSKATILKVFHIMNSLYYFGMRSLIRLHFLEARCQSSGSQLSNAGFPTLFKVLYNGQLEIE